MGRTNPAEPVVVLEWTHDGLCVAYNSDLPHVRAVDSSEDEAVQTLTTWYEQHSPTIYHGLPVMYFWWVFRHDPYHVYIAEHRYDDLHDEVVEKFQEIYGDPPNQVSAWSPEIQYVFPVEKLKFM
jgi:hypothetical protein